jgi:molybdenum cofactor sulfurtransferase
MENQLISASSILLYLLTVDTPTMKLSWRKSLGVNQRGRDEGTQRLHYNNEVEAMRKVQYPMLNGISPEFVLPSQSLTRRSGMTYLDHAGTTLPSKALSDSFARQLQTNLVANPHSALASSPSFTQKIVEDTRKSVLDLFHADSAHFEVVFVANATAAIKLVLEAFQGHEQGFDYYYHRDCHTSLVGVRELAHKSHCLASDEETEQWLSSGQSSSETDARNRPTLFSYPAQSNMNGRRLPLSWPGRLRSSPGHENTYTLLDVAALVSTTALDLSDPTRAPDFLSLSFYKIFGFPDLGALIVRKSAIHVFDHRRYFGGGTTEMITVDKPWFARKQKSLSDGVEDGTSATHNILALKCAIATHQTLYGGLSQVSKHTTWLAKQLYDHLSALRHANGRPVCHIYKDPSSSYGDGNTQGATVAFNIMNSNGAWVRTSDVGNRAMAAKIHLRAGGLCNPGGMADALGMSAEFLQEHHAAGWVCGQDSDHNAKPSGMVRASFGACSTLKDVLVLVQFVEDTYVKVAAPSPPKIMLVTAKIRSSWEAKVHSRMIRV